MQIIRLKRIYHRGFDRIGLFFSFDEKLRLCVRSIPGIKYSGTNKCFYTDYTEDSLRMIYSAFKDLAVIDSDEIGFNKATVIAETSSKEHQDEKRHSTDISHPIIRQDSNRVVFRINEETGALIIRLPVPFKSEWVDEIRSYRGRYDSTRREWHLAWSKLQCDSLSDYFSSAGVGLEIRKENINEELRQERKVMHDAIRERSLGRKSLDALDNLALYLDENRYSLRTRQSYLSMMEIFFRYFNTKDPETITSREISGFINDFIIRLDYSSTYQNQMISAIKVCNLFSGYGQIDLGQIGRPRKRRPLPKVLSKEEVGRILNSQGNIKHKLLLWMIYSCGLRRSEVTNIRLMDFDRDRSLIHIREGKGMVDRIVPVSQKVWLKIDEYLAVYSPREYLFEGQTGGRYSSESVYRVFKTALAKAGIRKDLGVHSLRHSYATHLHENGMDIKYIQELLGHKSTRTTEIYTHVSRRNLIAVRSPIDDLDVK